MDTVHLDATDTVGTDYENISGHSPSKHDMDIGHIEVIDGLTLQVEGTYPVSSQHGVESNSYNSNLEEFFEDPDDGDKDKTYHPVNSETNDTSSEEDSSIPPSKKKKGAHLTTLANIPMSFQNSENVSSVHDKSNGVPGSVSDEASSSSCY
ncbi:uncharacterized protein LOC120351129 [Nilaparvata lugens]|uniref:uncharacterized protein LOC120351129 n=1 Tax=Nilaparvata lugens TaxID=108931 RepID=UPI00193E32BC|nr:uncharacterized protein LOC120351129 [Nilaparvata lugens]